MFSIGPVVISKAAYLILFKLAVVVALFREDKFSSAMLSTLVIEAFIAGSIRPALISEAMLLVFEPLTLVLRSIHMSISALSVCLIIDPLSFISVSVRMIEFTVASRTILLVVALVAGAVRPLLHTETVPLISYPFTSVHTTIGKCNGRFFHPDCVHTNLLLIWFVSTTSLEVFIMHSLISHLQDIAVSSVILFWSSLIILSALLRLIVDIHFLVRMSRIRFLISGIGISK
jgi:hypothetical protein